MGFYNQSDTMYRQQTKQRWKSLISGPPSSLISFSSCCVKCLLPLAKNLVGHMSISLRKHDFVQDMFYQMFPYLVG